MYIINAAARKINVFFGRRYGDFGKMERDGALLNDISLYVSAQGCVLLDERWGAENVCDPFSRVYIVRRGEGFLRAGDKRIPLCGGNVYFIPAGLTFSYGCINLEKIYFHVNVNMGESELFAGAGRIGVLPFAEEKYALLERALSAPQGAEQLYVKSVLYGEISRFAKELTDGNVHRYGEIVRAALKVIRGKPRVDFRTNDLARMLFVSESKLRKTFRRETGVPIRRYIEDQALARAKAMLAEGSMSIDEIGEELGFCDRFHFTRRFSAAFGIPPAAYRSAVSYDFSGKADERK